MAVEAKLEVCSDATVSSDKKQNIAKEINRPLLNHLTYHLSLKGTALLLNNNILRFEFRSS